MLIKRREGRSGPRRLRTAVRIFLAILGFGVAVLVIFDIVRIAFFGETIAHALRQNWETVRPKWGSIPSYVLWVVIFTVCYVRDRDERRRLAARDAQPEL